MTDDEARARHIRENAIRAEGAKMVADAIARRYGNPYGWGPPIGLGHEFRERPARECHVMAWDIVNSLRGRIAP